MNAKEKLNLIYGMYGSLSNFSRKKLTYTNLGKLMNKNRMTMFKAVKRFEQLGHNIELFISKTVKPPNRKIIGSPEIEKKLIRKKCLL